jgi:hypothetical protein
MRMTTLVVAVRYSNILAWLASILLPLKKDNLKLNIPQAAARSSQRVCMRCNIILTLIHAQGIKY